MAFEAVSLNYGRTRLCVCIRARVRVGAFFLTCVCVLGVSNDACVGLYNGDLKEVLRQSLKSLPFPGETVFPAAKKRLPNSIAVVSAISDMPPPVHFHFHFIFYSLF